MFILWIMFYDLLMKLKLIKTRSTDLVKCFMTHSIQFITCQVAKVCGVYHDHIIFVKHKIVKFLLSTTEPRVSRIDNGFGCVKR
jgi:hypothetical protein